MKNFILFVLFFIPLQSFAQEDTLHIHKKPKKSIREIDVYFPGYYDDRYERVSQVSPKLMIEKWNYKRSGLALLSGFLGGVSWGIHETVHYHYSAFQKVHPNADPNWWDPSISWNNKNTSNIPFSRDFMVVFTDAKHLFAAANTLSLVGGTCVVVIGDKRKWYEYLVDLGIMFVGRSIGFQVTYNGIYSVK